MRRIVITIALIPLLYFVLTAAACRDLINAEKEGTAEGLLPTEPDPEPEPVVISIFVGGQCRVDGTRIECEDSSTSEPADLLVRVVWTLRSSTSGISLDTRNEDPDAEVSFAGLAPDVYEISQEVFDENGDSKRRTYSGLEVEGVEPAEEPEPVDAG